ncbi:MAG: hypothetical protein MRY57_03915 [Candidatus Pacebacteria bacterium]|nr:hypothetical protein [Candidatus Paceibacterota bacterium]
MNQEILTTEIQKYMDALGIHTKDIKLIQDNDIHITILSLIIRGNDIELFTDNHQELLRDLGLVFKLHIKNTFNIHKDLIIDVNGIQEKHINFTKEKAQIAVDRVLFFDKPYEFGYLNAYERMIIHSYLKKYPELHSISEGVGKDRRLRLEKRT